MGVRPGKANAVIKYCWFALLCLAFAAAGCNGGSGDNPDPDPDPQPKRFEILRTDTNGVFDAAPAEDGSGRIWMSHSEVSVSPLTPVTGSAVELDQTSTWLAYSDDDGANWQETGVVINPAEPITLPAPLTIGVWQQEVSRLVYDEFDTTTGKPWKMPWHRHLAAYHEGLDVVVRMLQHGWISLKSASTPQGLEFAPERRLFSGSLYDPVNDATIGVPEFKLDQLFPGSDELGECAVFTEPAILPHPHGLFVGMKCAKLSNPGKLVLLLCSEDFASCDYIGDLLDDTEASAFGESYDGFSAPELVHSQNQTYLIATPTEDDHYRGCLVFLVADLDSDIATLKQTELIERRNNAEKTPLLESSIFGTDGSFNGACGYTAGATGSGIIQSEYFPNEKPEFRLFATGQNF